MRDLLKEFRDFVMRGNVLDLAVAVVVGVAFNAVVQSFATDVLMGFIGAIFGKPNFDDLVLGVGDGVVVYGRFVTALVEFLIVAFAVFLAVKVFERLQSLRTRGGAEEPETPAPSDEAVLLAEIRDLLRSRT